MMAKSRMPVFDEDDEEQLANMMNNYNQGSNAKRPSPSQPSAVSAQTSAKTKPIIKPITNNNSNIIENKVLNKPMSTKSLPPPPILPPLVKPNPDWRTAKSDANPYVSTLYNAKKPPVVADDSDDYYSFTDLDYDDFEAAMREEENGDMGVKANKVTAAPVVTYEGLYSGDSLSPSIWSYLSYIDDTACDMSKVVRPNTDLMLIYSDPRRMTDEFKQVLRYICDIYYNIYIAYVYT